MPKRNTSPAFLFYPDDFTSDGKVEAMTTEEVGAYFLLLCKAWREKPVGSIPNDDSVLARWTRLQASRWAECRVKVLSPFKLGPANRLYQKRMRADYECQQKRLKFLSDSGKDGARKRWQKMKLDGQAIRPPIGNPNASSIPSSFPIFDGEKKKPAAADVPVPAVLDSPEFHTAWAEFIRHRREKNAKVTPTNAVRLLGEMEVWGVARSVAAMNFTVMKGWTGLREPDMPANGTETIADRAKRLAQMV